MQASWGTGLYRLARRGQQSKSKPWRGVALSPPGPTRPEEALGGAGLRLGDPHSRKRPGGGWLGLRPRTHAAGGGPGVGVQSQDHSRLTGGRAGGGESGHIPLWSLNPLKVPLHLCQSPRSEWGPPSVGTPPPPSHPSGPLVPSHFHFSSPILSTPMPYLVTWGFLPSP